MKIQEMFNIPEVINGIRDSVNEMREMYPSSKLVIAMPTWLYNELDHMRCDGSRTKNTETPKMFGIRVKTINVLDSVFVGREVRL